MTRPDVSSSDPWHGPRYVWSVKLDTTHASCVHWALTAANVVCPVRATRNSPAEDVTKAMPPVVSSGDPALMATDTAPLIDVPETVGSGWPGIELAGFDPQPGRIVARRSVHAATDGATARPSYLARLATSSSVATSATLRVNLISSAETTVPVYSMRSGIP